MAKIETFRSISIRNDLFTKFDQFDHIIEYWPSRKNYFNHVSKSGPTFLNMFSYNFSGITCRPSRVTKGTQTESVSQPVIVPVMVPIYLPVPMQMYQRPLPVPVPMPLPIPGKYHIFPLKVFII